MSQQWLIFSEENQMKSKINRFLDQSAMFRCPLCHADVYPRGTSLLCSNGHTFDLSKKGSVNFAPSQKPLKYTRELFDARGRIFDGGFYLPLFRKIEDTLSDYRQTLTTPSDELRIVDAGCGQGWYAKKLADDEHNIVTGFDLSPDAINQAASGAHNALFMVADVTNIPLQDHSQDVILDILTQANYQEFKRILKPGGLVIKVMPGTDYLQEIRQLLSPQLRQDSYSDQPVLEHFFSHHTNPAVTSIEYSLPLDPMQAKDFLLMTPLSLHVDKEAIDLDELTDITIHLNILTGQYA